MPCGSARHVGPAQIVGLRLMTLQPLTPHTTRLQAILSSAKTLFECVMSNELSVFASLACHIRVSLHLSHTVNHKLIGDNKDTFIYLETAYGESQLDQLSFNLRPLLFDN